MALLLIIVGYVLTMTFWFAQTLWSLSAWISRTGSLAGLLFFLTGLTLVMRQYRTEQHNCQKATPFQFSSPITGAGPTRPARLLLILAGSALLFRSAFYFYISGWFHSDHAITGLMAWHIAQGQPPPLYFYGQYYLGSLPAHLAALPMLLVGPKIHALKLVPLLCFVFFLFFQYRFLERSCCRNVAIGTTLLAIFAPGHFFQLSFDTSNGFMEMLMLTSIAFYLLELCLGYHVSGFRFRPVLLVLISGWSLGCAFWVNPQVVSLMIIAILFLNVRAFGPDLLRLNLFLGLGLLLGLFPLLLGELIYGFVQTIFLFSEKHAIPLSLTVFFQRTLHFARDGFALLLFEFQPQQVFLAFLFAVCQIIVPVLLILGLVLFRNDIGTFFRRKSVCPRPAIALVYLHVGLFLIIFLTSRFGDMISPPRYLVVLFFSVPVIISLPLAHARRSIRFLSQLLIILLVLGSLVHNYQSVQAARSSAALWDKYYSFLEENKVSYARCSYWMAYITSFMTAEKTICCPLPDFNRIPWYCERVERVKPALIYHDNIDPADARAMRAHFQAGRMPDYQCWYMPPFTVFYLIKEKE
ncbi:hypothetical protein JXQ70_14450 [bacterium]|nr:hypothetical protein [bacterium]